MAAGPAKKSAPNGTVAYWGAVGNVECAMPERAINTDPLSPTACSNGVRATPAPCARRKQTNRKRRTGFRGAWWRGSGFARNARCGTFYIFNYGRTRPSTRRCVELRIHRVAGDDPARCVLYMLSAAAGFPKVNHVSSRAAKKMYNWRKGTKREVATTAK